MPNTRTRSVINKEDEKESPEEIKRKHIQRTISSDEEYVPQTVTSRKSSRIEWNDLARRSKQTPERRARLEEISPCGSKTSSGGVRKKL